MAADADGNATDHQFAHRTTPADADRTSAAEDDPVASAGLGDRADWLRSQGEALIAAVNGAPLETSLGALVRTATKTLGGGARAAFYLVNGDGTTLHHVVGMPDEYARVVDGLAIGPESLACSLASNPEASVVTVDVRTEPRWAPWRWLADRYEYRGCWNFPIHSAAGMFVGTLAVYWREPRDTTPRDLELATLLTNTAAILIAGRQDAQRRQAAEDALRASERRYRALATASADVTYRMSPDWAEMRQLDGRGFLPDTAEPTGVWLERYVHPDDQPLVTNTIEEAKRAKRVFELEHRVIRADGTLGWTVSRAVPVLADDGTIVEWIGTASDVTARKEAEAARVADAASRLVTTSALDLIAAVSERTWSATKQARTERAPRESEERQAFLLRLSDALRPTSDPFEIQKTAVRLLGEHLDVMRATVFEVDADGDGFRLTARYERDAAPVPEQMRLSDFGPEIAAAYRAGQTVVFRDTETDTHLGSAPEMYRDLGLRAWIAAPLVKNGRLIAVVGVNSATAREWTDAHVRIVEDVADRTWAAVERARAEAALRESEARYRNLFETMRQGYLENELIRDADGRAVDYRTKLVNPQFERLTGISAGEAVGRTARELVGELDPVWIETYDRVVRTGEPEQFEREEPAFGRWFEVQAYPLTGDRFAILYDDITERRRTDAALRESEERYRDLFERMREGFCIIEVIFEGERAVDYVFVDINPAFVIQSDIVNAVGRRMRDIAPDHEEHWFKNFGEIARTGQPMRFEAPAKQLGNRWYDVNAFRVGEPEQHRVAIIFTDITQRRRDAAALRESERKFRSLFAASPAPFLIVKPDAPRFTVVEVNDAYLAATMRTREQLVGRGIFEAFPDNPDDKAIAGARTLRASLEDVLATRQQDTLPHLKYDIVRPDGTFEERWWSPVNSPLLDDSGNVEAIIHNSIDVTEEHRAIAALREREARLRGVLDGMGEGFGLLSPDFTILEHNREALRMDGRAREEIVGRSHWDAFPGSENTEVGRLLKTAMAERVAVSLEHQYAWEEGHARWLEMRAYPTDEGALAVFWTDVAKRRQAQDALRESEAHLARELEDARVLQKISNQLVSEAGPDGHYNHIVEVARTLMRSDAASIQELDAANSRLKLLAHTGIHAESAAFWAYVDADVGSSCGRALTARKRVVVPDMDKFEADPHDIAAYRKSGIMSVQSTPLVASSGRIVGMMSTHWTHPYAPSAESYRFFDVLARLAADFMERAHAEAALRESEATFRAVFETMIEACCIFEMIYDDLGTPVDWKISEANAGYERQSGLKDVAGKLASEVMPGTEAYWTETFGRVADTGEAEQIERWHQPTGRWVHSSTARVGDSGSRRLVSVFYDITERKRAEIAMRESEERQAFLLQLNDALRAEPDENGIANRAIQMVAAHLVVDSCYICRFDPVAGLGFVGPEQHAAGLAPVSGTYRLADLPPVITRIETAPLVIHDVSTDATLNDADRRSIAGLGVRATIAAVLRRGERNLAWGISVSQAVPRRWTAAEVMLVQEASERTWAAIERARAEASLRDSEERLRGLNEQLEERVRARTSEVRSLFKRLVSAQEEERRRIARDIHDQVGQQMTALRMNLEAVHAQAAGRTTLMEQAQRTLRLAEDLDQSIDFLTWQLRPAALDHLGLSAALQNLVTGWSERFAIPADFAVDGVDDVRLPRDVEANLYRIAQEALHNIAKHADATHVTVVLTERAGQLALVIEDNGRGFDPPASSTAQDSSGLGLISMRERAALVGGRLDIDSSADQGTSIYVRVPEPTGGA